MLSFPVALLSPGVCVSSVPGVSASGSVPSSPSVVPGSVESSCSVFPGSSSLFPSVWLPSTTWLPSPTWFWSTTWFPSTASVSPWSAKKIPIDNPAISNRIMIVTIAIIVFLLKVFDLPAIFIPPKNFLLLYFFCF